MWKSKRISVREEEKCDSCEEGIIYLEESDIDVRTEFISELDNQYSKGLVFEVQFNRLLDNLDKIDTNDLEQFLNSKGCL